MGWGDCPGQALYLQRRSVMPDPQNTPMAQQINPPAQPQPAQVNEPEITPRELLEEIIDPQRIEQIARTNEELQQKVSELEKKTQASQTQGPTKGWDTVSDRDLEYVIAHPSEYPEHAQGALSELRKRDRESVKAELSTELGTSDFMSKNKEAFDPNTPLGKEVQKILSQNRKQPEVLADVIELAQHRLGNSKTKQEGRKEVLDALKAAGAHTPGAEGITTPSAPSFMDMPKADFENEVQKVKMKAFKQ